LDDALLFLIFYGVQVAFLQADIMALFSATFLPEAAHEALYRPSAAAVESFWEGMEASVLAPVSVFPSDSGRGSLLCRLGTILFPVVQHLIVCYSHSFFFS
jgi:hypothetical protein